MAPSHGVVVRESKGEALTGRRAGWILSRESKINFGGADGVVWQEGNTEQIVIAKSCSAPAWSETLRTHAKRHTREPGRSRIWS